MTDAMNLAAAFAAGIVLGTLFFGGLWWSTHKGIAADNPALWFLGSLLLRTGALMAGFYAVAGGDWHRALACLLGFMLARMAILRLSHTLFRPSIAAMETHHES